MKVLGVIALTVIIGFGVTGCSKKEGGGSSGGSGSVNVGRAAPASDFNYKLSDDGKGVVITHYTGNGGVVVIPGEIEGLPVVELGYIAFSGYNAGPGYNVTSVVIPASVKMIAGACFGYIDNLTTVTFLGSGVVLSSNVFRDCKNLSVLNMPDGDRVLIPFNGRRGDLGIVTESNAFQNCKKLPLAVRSKLVSWGFDEP